MFGIYAYESTLLLNYNGTLMDEWRFCGSLCVFVCLSSRECTLSPDDFRLTHFALFLSSFDFIAVTSASAFNFFFCGTKESVCL